MPLTTAQLLLNEELSFNNGLPFFWKALKSPSFLKTENIPLYCAIIFFLIQWKNSMRTLCKRFAISTLSIKALRLFAMDTAAYRFLDSMATRYPDEILRNSESFVSLWYAPKIIAKLL
jgi:hypothetical protein